MENAEKTYKRRTIIIKKPLQYRYMSIISASAIFGFILIGLEIFWDISDILSRRPALITPLMDEFYALLPSIGVKILIYLAMIILVSAVVSHKMAGPIFKFERTAKKLAEGDLSEKIFLRKGDQLNELKDELNNMITSLSQKIGRDRKKIEDVSARLQNASARAGDDALKRELESIYREVITITKEFKL